MIAQEYAIRHADRLLSASFCNTYAHPGPLCLPGGHACAWEHPGPFNQAVLAFLDRVSARA